MHRVAFSVDDIEEALEIAARDGCHPLRAVAPYEDIYKLTYVRGPSDILVMLAEELKKSGPRFVAQRHARCERPRAVGRGQGRSDLGHRP
jgi:4-hydroxyphenylpyruvate dioxygenase-like putative hemolysin